MSVDIFGNAGMDTQNIGQAQGGAMPGGQSNSNPIIDALVQKLNAAQQTQKQVVLPQQLPPNHVQPGDVSGNFVNPSTVGGPAHNARVTLAQSIGGAVSQAINRHEDKEARDLSFDIQIMHTSMDTINDPNASPQNKQLAQQQLNDLTSDKGKMKKIQKALNIQLMGEDKRTPVEKKAVAMATEAQKLGGQPQQQQQQQRPMAETGGIPDNMQGLNSMARQLMSRMPTQTGLTSAAMAAAELTKSGVIPSAGEILKYASDQQYYEVMKDKMGVEAATKMAGIQEKAQAEIEKLQVEMQKETDKNKQNEIMNNMREVFHNASTALQEQRIQLMKDQLDEKTGKDSKDADLKSQKLVIDKLGKQSKSLNDQTAQLLKARDKAQKIASTGLFNTDAKKQATQDVQDINTKLQTLQAQQKAVNEALNSTSTGGSATPGIDPEYQKYADALDKKYGMSK